MMRSKVRIIGGGLAGCEAAHRLANRGIRVELHEMRPRRATEAHKTDGLAELVCSNSFKSLSLATAPGILKAEMDLLGSLGLDAARAASVPAGEALAVDRDIFSKFITEKISSHPNIELKREEILAIDGEDKTPTIIATGPLTSPALSESITRLTGEKEFYFYDAISPVVQTASIDFEKAFYANRHDKRTRQIEGALPFSAGSESQNADGSANIEEFGAGDSAAENSDRGDYINCPLSKAEYEAFVDALLQAERVEAKDFERVKHFEGCMPIEEMADRGRDTLRFGPMRPIGIIDPRTERRPWAVVQLRPENRSAAAYNLVGFQTKMKYGEQRRVFSMIPGLENAEFFRMGSMHRNAFVNAPRVLAENLSLNSAPHIFLAGQITGVEGYMESSAIGILAAIFLEASLQGKPYLLPPRGSALGALLSHLKNADSPDFQPMGINFGLFDENQYADGLERLRAQNPKQKKLPKQDKRRVMGELSLQAARAYKDSLTD